MVASRLLRAVAALVILLSFGAGLRKSYWSGCMKAATVICQQIFSILALAIFLLKILLKSASKSSFFHSGVEIHPVLELQFPTPLRGSSIVFCSSVSADRIVMAASRLLRAVAAFVILLSFAAGLRKSYWSGCMKAATVICQQIFLHFGASDFPTKNPFKKCFKIVFFFALASRSGFGATISDAVARSSIVFCNSVSADRIVMAASRLLRAVAAFVILLSFAARLRKSYWSGCMKAATVICQQIFSILSH